MVHTRYVLQGTHQIYGQIRCIYTVLANPTHNAQNTRLGRCLLTSPTTLDNADIIKSVVISNCTSPLPFSNCKPNTTTGISVSSSKSSSGKSSSSNCPPTCVYGALHFEPRRCQGNRPQLSVSHCLHSSHTPKRPHGLQSRDGCCDL